MNIINLRSEYSQCGLTRAELRKSPFEQFEIWFRKAIEDEIPEPNAMSLATVSDNGFPCQRTVLLKCYDKEGFVFFTNYKSKKAEHIERNPNVSLLFLWAILARQVQICGTAAKISTSESLKYFVTRPRGSQLGAWCSHQSSIISSRKLLELKLKEMKEKFFNRQVPLPSFWGGYRVVPVSFEFWQGQPNRLHDRFLYSRNKDNSWKIERLAP